MLPINDIETRKRVLVVGAKGLLGQRIAHTLQRETNWEIIIATRTHISNGIQTLEIDTMSLRTWLQCLNQDLWRPTTIINAAAYTNVDTCETNRETAWQINVKLVEYLTQAAKSVDAQFVQISTDYIFDGTSGPYTEEATPNPINYYGRTKLAAENVCHRSNVSCLIARTMWLYGIHNGGRSTFVDWALNSLRNARPLSVVTDEIGTPTLTDDIADAMVRVVERKQNGIMNLSGRTIQSRREMAIEIAEVFGYDPERIANTTTASLQRAARRPLRSGLISLKAEAALGMTFSTTNSGLTYVKTALQRGQEDII